jgi:hypothetical protein
MCVYERQNLLEGKAIFLEHYQRNLHNSRIVFALPACLPACLYVCCTCVRIQERLDGFSINSILESLKYIVILGKIR